MKYDAIILGFGKAGKTLAGALAAKGEKVALIEKSEKMYGGTCINVGCIPSKSLVKSGEESALNSESDFSEKARRYKEAIEEKRRVTSFLRKKNFDKLNDLENITIYNGVGRFLSSTQVQVLSKAGEPETLQGNKIFINTGAGAVQPNIVGIKDNEKVYTSESLMEESELPKRLTLIGAGYIGMEFASMYTNFGSKVTVLQDGDAFLPREDRDVAEMIKEILEKRGVEFIMGARISAIDKGDVIYEKDGKEETVGGDAVLLATGRKPNVEGLQTEKAGIELTERGAVKVDESLQTNVPGIWAMGDVNGGPQFTFISLDDYRIVLDQLNQGSHVHQERKNVPYSVFMDTPLSRVGITEMEAKKQNLPYVIKKLPTAAIPKAQVLKKTDGFLKVLIHKETDRILGAALLCPESYEMINLVKLAMDMEADCKILKNQIYTHPTMTEAFNDLF